MTFLLGLKKKPKRPKGAGLPDHVYDDILGSVGARQEDRETEGLLVDRLDITPRELCEVFLLPGRSTSPSALTSG